MVAAALLENHMMKMKPMLALLLWLPLAAMAEQYVTIIQGLDGAPEYGAQFNGQSEKLVSAAGSITDVKRVKLLSGDEATREKILSHFGELEKSLKADDRLALFLVGHGSYDGFEYKFNIPGPDLTGEDLVASLDKLAAKRQIVVSLGSSSGALQALLKSDMRTVLTATRNGEERLATRFATYFANALEDTAADTNKNNAISLQEAFDFASRNVKDYFETQGQLATEHAVVSNDTSAQFVLARIGKRPSQQTDPELAGLMARRDKLDADIEQLQLRKSEMETEQYTNELQQLMIDLSLVQEMIDQKESPGVE